MKKLLTFAVTAIAFAASSASAATLGSVACGSDTVTFNFTGVTAGTNVTMEASQNGSSWSIIGAGELDGSSASVAIGVPTNLSEFTDIISDKSTAQYRAVIDGSTVTRSCS